MYDELIDWLRAVLGTGYQFSRGMWVDHPALAGAFICAVHSAGGAAVSVDDRRPRYRVLLIGPQNGRQHAQALQDAANAIIQATMDDSAPCGAAHLRAMSEATGPGYTSENRPWYSLDLQATH